MTATASSQLHEIAALLARHGYEVSPAGEGILNVREVQSGVSVSAVLEGEIMFFTVPCETVPAASVTTEMMRKMLDGNNGISTSHFQLYDAPGGNVTIALNNFCKLQELGPDDEDDILSCVHFVIADVFEARHLLGLAK